MSVQWMSHILANVPATISGSDRLVLLVLANYANDDGICWPSVARIGQDAALSVRRTQDALRRLEATGYLTRELNQQPMHIKGGARSQDRRTNLYCLHLEPAVGVDDASTPTPASGVDDRDATGWTDRPDTGWTKCPQEPSVDQPSGEPPVTPSAASAASGALTAEEAFDLFWERYPERDGRKRDKAKALAQWKRLGVSDRRAAYRAVLHYAADLAVSGVSARDAHRWLRDHAWVDYAEPVRSGPVPIRGQRGPLSPAALGQEYLRRKAGA